VQQQFHAKTGETKRATMAKKAIIVAVLNHFFVFGIIIG